MCSEQEQHGNVWDVDVSKIRSASSWGHTKELNVRELDMGLLSQLITVPTFVMHFFPFVLELDWRLVHSALA